MAMIGRLHFEPFGSRPKMERVQLFELEDYPWFPQTIRDGITGFLNYLVSRSGLFNSIAPRLAQALEVTRATQVIDLCSGGGGPWLTLKQSARDAALHDVDVLLTDYFPNIPALSETREASQGHIDFVDESVDARRVPERLDGFRTLFQSFHHFDPEAARDIIRDAVVHGRGIAIFESTQRHPLMLLYMLLTPLIVMLTVPFHRGLRMSKLFWTYIIPAIPLVVMFDGLISCLRTYTPRELERMARSIPGAENYHWSFGVERMGILPVGVTYMIGYPASDLPPRTDG